MKHRTCIKCFATKPLSMFYANKAAALGVDSKCKECAKRLSTLRRNRNLESVRAYDRARGSRMTVDDLRNYRKKNPEKHRAHQLVRNAINRGDLVRPSVCESCDQNGYIEGHHDDYSQPLVVRWLCAACHKQHHAQENRMSGVKR